MDSPIRPLASSPNPQSSSCAGPLAGVLRDEHSRLQEQAHDAETELVKRGKPLTSASLTETQRQIATLQAGLQVAETCDQPRRIGPDSTQAAEVAPLPRIASL